MVATGIEIDKRGGDRDGDGDGDDTEFGNTTIRDCDGFFDDDDGVNAASLYLDESRES